MKKTIAILDTKKIYFRKYPNELIYFENGQLNVFYKKAYKNMFFKDISNITYKENKNLTGTITITHLDKKYKIKYIKNVKNVYDLLSKINNAEYIVPIQEII